jgi:solute carrier family 25 (mitochondrial citrate transporter), member 1
MPEKEKSALLSLTAGMIAGTVEGFITYPTEYIKTQLQIHKQYNFQVLSSTIRKNGITSMYRGVGALMTGNSFKAGTRFYVFDQSKLLFTQWGCPHPMVFAGLVAGICEAVFVVTPSETIKTKLIHDQNRPIPRYRGMFDCIRVSFQEQGIKGIYKGMGAVVARQGANSAVRMSTYGHIKEFVHDRYEGKVPWYGTFLIGAIAGTITVYATMPFDVVKTKMQSLDSEKYKSVVGCLKSVVQEQGVLGLWKGAVPRLGRLVFSGGIVFTVYESVMDLHTLLTSKK